MYMKNRCDKQKDGDRNITIIKVKINLAITGLSTCFVVEGRITKEADSKGQRRIKYFY